MRSSCRGHIFRGSTMRSIRPTRIWTRSTTMRELVNVITLRSRMVEAHPKIKSAPFEGSYQFTVKVRPPARPRGAYRLAVSFQFTVRDGCSVEVTAADNETVEVIVTLDSGKYTPPKPPTRRSCVYSKDELNALSPGTGKDILEIDVVAPLVGVLLAFGGLWLAIYIEYILARLQGRRLRSDSGMSLAYEMSG